MKTFLKIIAGIGVFIGLIIGVVFYFTADLTHVAEEFFEAVKSDDMTQAASYLSEDFVASTSLDELRVYMRDNRLDQYTGASWGSRNISAGVGSLSGTIATTSGGSIPLTITFVKAADGWKIQALKKAIAGAGVVDTSDAIPNEEETLALVTESMTIFGRSVGSPDMSEFYQHLSTLWRNQATQADIEKIFAGQYDGWNLEGLFSNTPSFKTKPQLNENGWLVVEGYYLAPPYRFNFTHKYAKEGLRWKLVGFSTWPDSLEQSSE